MAIRGSLREASLSDVIQLLFLGRRSGCLSVAHRHPHGSIYFEEGWIIYATIVNRRDRLGDMLLASGAVSREQLDQALALQSTAPTRRIGDLFLDMGLISPAELRRHVRVQIEEAVYSLFAWTSGTFVFDPDVRPDGSDQLDRINPESLLLEAARRVDEWSLIEARIPSFDLIFAVLPGQIEGHQAAFTEAQRRLLPLLDGRRDVREAIDRSGPRPALLLDLALALEHLGNLDQAETILAEAASRAGDDPGIQTGWGVLALERGEPLVAKQRLHRARHLYRDDPPPALWYWAAARSAAEAENLDSAVEVARDGLERYPADPVLRNTLAG